MIHIDAAVLSRLEFKVARLALARARCWRNMGSMDTYEMELRLAKAYRERAKYWMRKR